MFTENELSVFDFASCISEAIDLVFPVLNNHHKKVAYIAYNIAKEMKLPDNDTRDIVLAAILHDIGAFSSAERKRLATAEFDDSAHNEHCEVGYKLLRKFEPLENAATLIRYHHIQFDNALKDTPLGSSIVHLADRLSVLLNEREEILAQIPEIMGKIEENSHTFNPDALTALRKFEKYEYFWIEACSLPISDMLPERMMFARNIIDLDMLRSFARVVAQIIDYRSRFTSTHSCGVAAVALELARISGFSERECKMMEIAGFLHDLGKLAISSEILEKNGSLSYEEFNEMRKHSYYTYAVLSRIKGLEHIASLAAHHHERLDGNGYPFHVKGGDISKLARIMAVSDIVTALTEDRPYRDGMNCADTLGILTDMVKNDAIDEGVVDDVKANFSYIDGVRLKAQHEALVDYNEFRSAD